MADDYLIGVDGGQTSTKCVLVTTTGRILGHGRGRGLVHLAAEGARAQYAHALHEAFTAMWHSAGRAPQPVVGIGLGLTGVEAGTPESALVHNIVHEVIAAHHVVVHHVVVHSDAYAALIGAHRGRPGIIAISGTGSHILGLNAHGEVARAGGWGWLLGDEGSAMWIGKAGLNAALRALDGLDRPTALQALLCRHFGIAALHEVKRLVYAPDFGAKGFAGLAPLIAHAAEQGDATAADIIARAGSDLATQVTAVQRRLRLPPDAPVAPVGGAYEHVQGLREHFVSALCRLNPQAKVVMPELPPTLGAVLMVAKACGLSPGL